MVELVGLHLVIECKHLGQQERRDAACRRTFSSKGQTYEVSFGLGILSKRMYRGEKSNTISTGSELVDYIGVEIWIDLEIVCGQS